MTADPKIFPEKETASVGGEIASGRPGRLPSESGAETRKSLRPAPLDLWLHRITVLLFVFVCAVVGVLLVILPWRPEWTDNRLLLTYPSLRAIVANGFVRGVCSGLGMLDIWIGFWEAIHYHEGERP